MLTSSFNFIELYIKCIAPSTNNYLKLGYTFSIVGSFIAFPFLGPSSNLLSNFVLKCNLYENFKHIL